jgi:hypothetical protein
MKKLAIFAVSLLTAGASLAGNIGENFEASGFSLGGYVNYQSDSDTGYSDLTLSPYVRFYPKQNVAVYTGFYHSSWGYDGFTQQYTSLSVGVGYNFGYDESAHSGLVHEVGFSGYRGVYTSTAGEKGDASMYLTPYYRADYFLTDRISVYGTARFFDLNLSTGAEELIDSSLDLTAGISVHFPNSFRDWSKVLKK